MYGCSGAMAKLSNLQFIVNLAAHSHKPEPQLCSSYLKMSLLNVSKNLLLAREQYQLQTCPVAQC